MKPIIIYNVELDNNYLIQYYYDSIYKYCLDKKIPICFGEDLDKIQNSTILIRADFLTPQVILQLKNNNNFICSFNLSDTSSLCWVHESCNEMLLIDLIFKFSGVLKTEFTDELYIQNNLSYTIEQVKSGGASWDLYTKIKNSNKIVPCPHVPADNSSFQINNNPKSFLERRKKCLIRGGHHFYRFFLLLNLIKNNILDEESGFFPSHYSHIYCDNCKKIINNKGFTFQDYKEARQKKCCISPNKDWLLEDIPSDFLRHHGPWCNRCPSSFFWLTEQWEKKHGNINRKLIENIFNAKMRSEQDLNDNILNNILFAGDYKWPNCINLAQRFWLTARAKTINLLPERTKDQDYFPTCIENEHYISFSNDFSNLKDKIENITQEQYLHISNNCFEQYKYWIAGTNYKVSTNHLKYILTCIENQQNCF